MILIGTRVQIGTKKEAYEVLRKELDKTKEAAQKLEDKAKRKLESEVREKLKDYIEGGVKEDGVKIYGNHASITLKDNKKEFKISEFLNSDFCQKNGISGFSTLHSDGKSGMHGFVAEEGGRKIRHYVVTDGSYEMTLNWYVNGEKCTITININANGSVERIEGHDVNEKQLQANKDIKIGNLYLYEVLAKGRWKEAQHNKKDKPDLNQSFETIITNNSRNQEVEKPAQKNKATYTTQEAGSQTPPPPRTSSLKKNVFDKQGENSSTKFASQDGEQNKLSSNATDMAQKQFIENVLEKIEKGSQYDSIRNWLKDKIEGKENNQNLDALEEKLSKKYSQDNTTEKRESDDSKPLSPTSTGVNTDVEHISDTQPQKNSYRSRQEPEEEERNFQKINKAFGEWKDNRRNARQSNSSSSSPIYASHYESQVNPKQLKASLMNVEQSDDTLLTEFTGKLDKETQKFPLRPVTQKGISEQTRECLLEAGLLKDDSTDIKTMVKRENANTNLTIDKNSELSKLLARDEEQLKTGVIEAEREDTLVEHTNSHDRNRIALANRNRKLLWTEHIKQQQERDKCVSI